MKLPAVGSVAIVRERGRIEDPHPFAGCKVVVVAHGGIGGVIALVQTPWSRVREVLVGVLKRAGIANDLDVQTARQAAGVDGLYFETFSACELDVIDEAPVCPRCAQTCHGVRRLVGNFVLFRHDESGHAVEVPHAL